jgi:hypothetical protein
MSLGNALSNAAVSLLQSLGNNVGGIFTGTNPAIQPTIGSVFNTSIPATPLISTRDYFLFQLNSWVTSFPLMSQWIAVIESYPAALNTTLLQGLERVAGNKHSFDINYAKTILTSAPFQRVSGCLFCSNCMIPEESFQVKNIEIKNNRGFIPGVAAGERQPYAGKPLALSFYETSTSFLDFVIRPWIILGGHYGFVAREGDTTVSKSAFNVKTNITLMFFNRTFQNISQIPRKVFRFYNCAPIQVSQQDYGYEEPGTVKSVNVNFAYTNYTIENNLYLPIPNIIEAFKQGDQPVISPLQTRVG